MKVWENILGYTQTVQTISQRALHKQPFAGIHLDGLERIGYCVTIAANNTDKGFRKMDIAYCGWPASACFSMHQTIVSAVQTFWYSRHDHTDASFSDHGNHMVQWLQNIEDHNSNLMISHDKYGRFWFVDPVSRVSHCWCISQGHCLFFELGSPIVGTAQ